MVLNDDIVDVEKPDGTISFTFVVNKLPGLFVDPLIFSIKYSR